MNTRAPAIEARQLIKTYGGEVTALNGIDVVVERGSVFGLLGPNGAGKSTTVKILTTLARPDSGSATVAEPRSGCVSVARIFTVVDLPAPFGPSSPNTSPTATSKSLPRTASTPS